MLQNELQRYIFKIHSAKLREAKWNLTLPLSEARKNDEVISLAGSQILRWIDELNGDNDSEERAREIKREIKEIKRNDNTPQSKRRIRQLYGKLDEIQFKPDYVSIVIDRITDYRRLCKGFKINGIEYMRLLGTSGGIKMSTIVFVSARLHDELERRINNGRDMTKKFNPAKLEAYRALTCSASIPVSWPNGIAVVKDCMTEFYDTVIHLRNGEGDEEPVMSEPREEPIKLDASDGFGMMLPSLAERWSHELGLDYIIAGANTRCSYEKGMLFTFDFLDFAENIGNKYIITDVWGNEVDLRNVEIILTESMLKLWDSYSSCEEYINNSISNNYTFALTKTTPKKLEDERCLNYQFIQSFKLDDNDIDSLISMSMQEISGVLGGDWRKTLLFLNGAGMNEKNVLKLPDNYNKAIMINPEVINDPHSRENIYRQIQKRIKDAKTGVIKIHGNFSIASGDPFALCQSMFGQKVTGLLKAGEIYNKYWSDLNTESVVVFRAPMSCHNNIRKAHPANYKEVNYWYRYMDACTIFNAWDTCMPALNGMDFDGDLVMLTDQPVLVEKHRKLPALMCEQSSAAKIIPTELDFINSNIAGFGNDIGSITNRITSMYELQSKFDEESDEYKVLDYRICCGQLHQQDCIDKIKGIIAKPMAKSWYDRHAVYQIEDEDKREFYLKIVADKKPYFMKYIYSSLSNDVRKFEKKSSENALRLFDTNMAGLLAKKEDEITQEESRFISRCKNHLPVGTGNCVINNICNLFENRFDSSEKRYEHVDFDYSIYKSGISYSDKDRKKIETLYGDYNTRLREYMVFLEYEREDDFDIVAKVQQLEDEFVAECSCICPNKEMLCDIILDITYGKHGSKAFAWEMCGDVIIKNLMDKFGNRLSFPVSDNNGDIYYCGQYFSLQTIELEGCD